MWFTLWRSWFWAVIAAEFTGFIAPAVVGALTANQQAGGVVLAYLAGSTPSTAHDARLSLVLFILVVAVAGVLLPSLGGSQCFLMELMVFLGFTMPLWRAEQPLVLIVLIGAVGGLLMAA